LSLDVFFYYFFRNRSDSAAKISSSPQVTSPDIFFRVQETLSLGYKPYDLSNIVPFSMVTDDLELSQVREHDQALYFL
jgi:hypothetical protein